MIGVNDHAAAGMGLKAIDKVTTYNFESVQSSMLVNLFNAGTHEASPEIFISGSFQGLEIGSLISTSFRETIRLTALMDIYIHFLIELIPVTNLVVSSSLYHLVIQN